MNTRQEKGSWRATIEWLGLRPQRLLAELPAWSTLDSFRSGEDLEWLWRDGGHFGELRDDMWTRAGLPGPSPQRAGWWPARGPQWDGVAVVPGRGGERGLLLVEAKSHLDEVVSHAAARPKSRAVIDAALDETKEAVGANPWIDWTEPRYQYANRLAWLHYLREHAGVEAWLLFVYFTGDGFESSPPRERTFPESADEWLDSIIETHEYLGLPEDHGLADRVRSVFLPADPFNPGERQGDG